MSTSGGSSGGGGSLPITHDDGTTIDTITAPANALALDCFDDLTGIWGAATSYGSNGPAQKGTYNAAAESNVHGVELVLTADDLLGATATLLVDGKGLTVDANGNPVWNGTLPPAMILSRTTDINAAAIAALNSSPAVVVPAPGVGKFVLMFNLFVKYVPTGSTFAFPGGRTLTTKWGAAGQASMSDRFEDVFNPPAVPTWKQETFGGTTSTAAATLANAPVVCVAGGSDPTPVGSITTSTLAAGGALYAPGDTGTIILPYGTGTPAEYVVDTVTVGGVVATYHLSSAGADGYDTLNNPLGTTPGGAQPGLGDGNFAINVTAIPAATGHLFVTCYYLVITP